MKLEPLGAARLVSPDPLSGSPLERARALAGLARAIEARAPGADVVVGGRSVLVIGAAELDHLEVLPASAHEPALHELEVVYDGEDLQGVASEVGLSPEELVERHTGPTYVALLTGFMPGFAYLAGLDPRLVRPRLSRPRARVPAGAVAIAGPLSGVYPFASPGGWRLLGNAVAPRLFDPARHPPQRIRALDEVRFVRVPRAPALASPATSPRAEPPSSAALELERVSGLVTVQDRGRLGLRGRGIPCSGAVDLEALAAANAAVGNPADAACLEVLMGKATVVARRAAYISVDGAPERRLEPGDRALIDPGAKLSAYLAVRGGLGVPEVLGSRSTFCLAGLGGHEGRPLRRGDVLELAPPGEAPPPTPAPALCPLPEVATLELSPGPRDDRLDETALSALTAGERSVSSRLDRVGVRFDGPPIPRSSGDLALPDPTLPGALQITTDGTPIALGPDCAVTGGYPVAGVLSEPSRALLGRLRPGHPVRFRFT